MATMASKKEAKGSLSVSETTGNRGLDTDKGPTFKDFGGIKKVIEDLKMNVVYPILNPQPYQKLGVKPLSGILFHGPPGCGKTTLANAIANEAGVPFYKISAIDIASGASEENIQELFSKAYRTAPSIVLIDDIDAIASKKDQQGEMEKRIIVTQLKTCMDGYDNRGADYVLVIGATNRPDDLDPGFRRHGRFEWEIGLTVPNEEERAEILAVVTKKFTLEDSADMRRIARMTPGFVGADLRDVVNIAGKIALKRIWDSRKSEVSKSDEDDKLFVSTSHFKEAVKSSKKEVPDIDIDDVGGRDHLRQTFKQKTKYY